MKNLHKEFVRLGKHLSNKEYLRKILETMNKESKPQRLEKKSMKPKKSPATFLFTKEMASANNAVTHDATDQQMLYITQIDFLNLTIIKISNLSAKIIMNSHIMASQNQ